MNKLNKILFTMVATLMFSSYPISAQRQITTIVKVINKTQYEAHISCLCGDGSVEKVVLPQSEMSVYGRYDISMKFDMPIFQIIGVSRWVPVSNRSIYSYLSLDKNGETIEENLIKETRKIIALDEGRGKLLTDWNECLYISKAAILIIDCDGSLHIKEYAVLDDQKDLEGLSQAQTILHGID
ncbi:TPA: hypothetical protein DEO28_02130 [Candidatus Dependentiae bacterium]|nr:MAG: hypothetical protein UR14_C0009G0026 [candidate division TM6 bacterium GW2011_GWE2_31_21]KKP52533.1 MAG: hypothetical protein UR43_C0012G0002 [candidate division TM6 bacterium GW2011_GWF2_33_332]HBS48438.1 hypothetical protein [Candidatus Dependentiae bacterium]HBZ73287.1 hypothetical protein [Candidatus Dependentiae bacterium]